VTAVSNFAKQCPNAQIVMVGYSQGSEIIDTVLCMLSLTCRETFIDDILIGGGGDPKQGVSSTGSIAGYNIKAAIFMGDPRFEAGAPYDVSSVYR
jgi:acetylxylan esterase